MFWDDSCPYWYVRRGTVDGRTILAGGCDHRTGDGDPIVAREKLETWIRQRFDVEEIVSWWSAEFFESTDGLPFIGKVAGKGNVWIANGLSGVGLTLGTAAGTMLADLIGGKPHELEDALSPGRVDPLSAGKVIVEQITAVRDYAERVLPAATIDPEHLKPGQGAVGTIDGEHVAVCRDRDGCLHKHSPLCTHMGGVVHWNAVEQTWDCPVHGGRFAADGNRLYGPPEDALNQFGKESQTTNS